MAGIRTFTRVSRSSQPRPGRTSERVTPERRRREISLCYELPSPGSKHRSEGRQRVGALSAGLFASCLTSSPCPWETDVRAPPRRSNARARPGRSVHAAVSPGAPREPTPWARTMVAGLRWWYRGGVKLQFDVSREFYGQNVRGLQASYVPPGRQRALHIASMELGTA